MKIIKLTIGMSLMFGITALGAMAQSVQSDFDRAADLSKLRTFTFSGDVRNIRRQSSADLMTDQRIVAALDRSLAANGFERNDTGRADFKVTYFVAARNKLNLREYTYGPRWFGGRDLRVDEYTEGTLIVDIIDTSTKQVVWRGRASGAVELKSVDKKIARSVEKIVAQFVKDAKKEVKKA